MRDLSAQPDVLTVADAPASENGIVLQQRHAFTDVSLLSRTVAEHERRLAAVPDDTETLRQIRPSFVKKLGLADVVLVRPEERS